MKSLSFKFSMILIISLALYLTYPYSGSADYTDPVIPTGEWTYFYMDIKTNDTVTVFYPRDGYHNVTVFVNLTEGGPLYITYFRDDMGEHITMDKIGNYTIHFINREQCPNNCVAPSEVLNDPFQFWVPLTYGIANFDFAVFPPYVDNFTHGFAKGWYKIVDHGIIPMTSNSVSFDFFTPEVLIGLSILFIIRIRRLNSRKFE